MTGWLVFHVEDTMFLKNLGVEIVSTKQASHTADPAVLEAQVKVSDEAFDKLNPWWGRFIWGLQ